MSKAKDFQRETAERIIEIFIGGQKRVLLSDEVGLGKTIMARTVIEKAKSLPGIEDDGIYRVIYVCSNQNIIRQNTKNLGIPEEDIMQLRDSRLSMQHLLLQERTQKQKTANIDGLPVQLIPLTPATSFNITGGAGNASERALIYTILRNMDEFSDSHPTLSRLLKTRNMGDKGWKEQLDAYIPRVDKCGYDYVQDILCSLKKNASFLSVFEELKTSVVNGKDEVSNQVINKIRIAFSQISLKRLEPDLVIMDEFQKFSGLLNTEEYTEESMIAHEFFSNNHPYILLLSATPYKPFTTLEELNEDNCDEQYEDFLKLMRFLFKSEKEKEFETIWEDYSNKLSHISSEGFDALVISKQKAEDKMFDVMCRTERFSEGLIKTVPFEKMEITEGDILSYCQMQKLLAEAKKTLSRRKNIGINPSYDIPIEYVKSSPYLLSFMEKYQEGKTIETAFEGKDVPVIKNSRSQKLLLKWGHIYNYKQIQSGNAKLEALQKMIFKNHAERLLWVPASHPYYAVPESNVFAKNKDFSKVLVFSAWEMVPRMLAIMLSYESERLNVGSVYKDVGVTYKTQKKIGTNRIQEEGSALLEYPSSYLAGKYDFNQYFGKHIDNIIEEIEEEIQQEIYELNVSNLNTTGAEALLNLIKRLEGQDIELRGVPHNAARILAYMAIGSPAVCMLRIMNNANIPEDASDNYRSESAQDIADSIVAMFNRRESSAAVELTTPKDMLYFEQVLHYCVMGNLQSVLDEYCHMIDSSNAKKIVDCMHNTFISVSPYRIETTESYCKKDVQANAMRRNFAFDYAKVIADNNLKHNGTLQQAFNSPFRPFVLSTTSVGQEGLDFHWYSRKIVHWNLPSNPVDMEQREGRINRFKCLAIRRNIVKFFGNKHTWDDMFEEADRQWRQDSGSNYSEMVPFWCLPIEVIKEHDNELEHIERLVPLFPMSVDQTRYKHLIDVLSLYRLTMGQPRQEELLQLLEGKVNNEQIKQLLFDLSPYNRKRRK